MHACKYLRTKGSKKKNENKKRQKKKRTSYIYIMLNCHGGNTKIAIRLGIMLYLNLC